MLVMRKRKRDKPVFPKVTPTEYAILDVLRSGVEMYGLEIVKEADGAVAKGSIYVLLARLSDKSFVEMRPEYNDLVHPGLPRHRYRITGQGSQALRAVDAARVVMNGGVPDVGI